MDNISPISLYMQLFESVFIIKDFDILLNHQKNDHAIKLVSGAKLKLSNLKIVILFFYFLFYYLVSLIFPFLFSLFGLS